MTSHQARIQRTTLPDGRTEIYCVYPDGHREPFADQTDEQIAAFMELAATTCTTPGCPGFGRRHAIQGSDELEEMLENTTGDDSGHE